MARIRIPNLNALQLKDNDTESCHWSSADHQGLGLVPPQDGHQQVLLGERALLQVLVVRSSLESCRRIGTKPARLKTLHSEPRSMGTPQGLIQWNCRHGGLHVAIWGDQSCVSQVRPNPKT